MKHLVKLFLVLLALGPLTASAFVSWTSDEDIIGSDSSMLSKMYENSPLRIVAQVSDRNPDSWRVTLNSMLGTIKALGEKKPLVEIVAFGPGIEGLKRGSEWANLVQQTLDAGVDIMVCETAMAAHHFTHEDMLPNLKFVPVGALEVIQKQRAGYFYLRP